LTNCNNCCKVKKQIRTFKLNLKYPDMKIKQVISENPLDFYGLLMVFAIFLFAVILPDSIISPKETWTNLIQPFHFWATYVVIIIATIAGYANGKEQRREYFFGLGTSLLVVFILIFDLRFLYKQLGCEDHTLVTMLAYAGYVIVRATTLSLAKD